MTTILLEHLLAPDALLMALLKYHYFHLFLILVRDTITLLY